MKDSVKNDRPDRFRTVNERQFKKCNGALHPTGGAFLPIEEFWVHKTGSKQGRVFHQCAKCMKYPKSPKLGKVISLDQQRILRSYKKISKETFKVEKGVLYKRCSGPAHDEPTWLPAERKYFYLTKRGTLYNRCRLCCAYVHAEIPEDSGFIPIGKVAVYFKEAVWRVGMMETCRRINFTDTQMRRVINGKSQYVRKQTFKRLMLELISMRRKGEVRHRDSIKNGTAMRGKVEKVPTTRQDYNKPTGDNDLAARRNYRRVNFENERKTERARKDRKKVSVS